jgi:Protein of unknown function (DUF1345)
VHPSVCTAPGLLDQVLTVLLSWKVVNTVFTLRDAGLTFGSGDAGIVFGDSDGPEGSMYRDFAYVAFTIGTCYQLSDTTVRVRRIRRTVLSPQCQKVWCASAASSSRSGPTTMVVRCPPANTSRQGSLRVGFSACEPVSARRLVSARP